jgi:hypothetical protein
LFALKIGVFVQYDRFIIAKEAATTLPNAELYTSDSALLISFCQVESFATEAIAGNL